VKHSNNSEQVILKINSQLWGLLIKWNITQITVQQFWKTEICGNICYIWHHLTTVPLHCIDAAVLQSVLGLMKRLRFSGKVFSDNVLNSNGDHLPGSLYYCYLPEVIYWRGKRIFHLWVIFPCIDPRTVTSILPLPVAIPFGPGIFSCLVIVASHFVSTHTRNLGSFQFQFGATPHVGRHFEVIAIQWERPEVFSDNVASSNKDHLPGSLYYCLGLSPFFRFGMLNWSTARKLSIFVKCTWKHLNCLNSAMWGKF